MAYPILGTPSPQFLDSSGDPLASGTITTLDPADDSVKASYPTADDADASTNGTSGDITLDASGRPTSTQYWGRDGEDYKVVIKDSSGSTVLTMDDIRMAGPHRQPTTVFTSTDATPSVANGNRFQTAGSTTITDFDDGQVGDRITIEATAEININSNSFVKLKHGLDFNMQDGDTLELTMFDDQVWVETGRSKDDPYQALLSGKTLVEGDTGTKYVLSSAGGFTVTLPAPVAGLSFEFYVATAPTTAYIISTNSSDNIIYGTICDTTATTAANAEDTINFVANTSLIGDWVKLWTEGSYWYMFAQSQANGGITVSAT